MPGSAKCIMRQLKELQRQPVVGAAAAPCNDDLNEIHCSVVGQTGPYKGVSVHFVLEINSDYPLSAPSAYFVTPIAYRGGAVSTDSKGRRAVCLNIFGNYKAYHGEWGSTNEGWSPAYTLETVLVQMQSLLANDDGLLSASPDDVGAAKAFAETLSCPCGHTPSTPYPVVEVTVAPRAFSERDNLLCYSSGARIDEDDAVLGIGVTITHTLTTPGEILSHEAFQRGVRKSSDNLKTFTHFLPISHTDEHHKRMKPLLVSCLGEIAREQGSKGKSPPDTWAMRLVEVATLLMTSLVVEVAQQVDGTTSDKFIECYYSLLDMLRRADDDAGGVIAAHVNSLLADFIKGEEHQVKSKVPNLGSVLALLPLSKMSWADIADPFLEEAAARSIFWVVQGPFSNRGPHPELCSRMAANRASKMFAATSVGRTLLCFQSTFERLAKGVLGEELKMDEAKAAIKKAFTEVKIISSWDEHFAYLGVPPCADHNRRLLNALDRSERSGYHGGTKGQKGKGAKGTKGSKGAKGSKGSKGCKGKGHR